MRCEKEEKLKTRIDFYSSDYCLAQTKEDGLFINVAIDTIEQKVLCTSRYGRIMSIPFLNLFKQFKPSFIKEIGPRFVLHGEGLIIDNLNKNKVFDRKKGNGRINSLIEDIIHIIKV